MKEWSNWLVVVLLGACSSAGVADNYIAQWNPDISSSAYWIQQSTKTIHIYEGDPYHDFKFEAYDDDTLLPGDIDRIILEDDGASAVSIRIKGKVGDVPFPYYGARNVQYIWVKLGTAPRNLKELDITGDLGFDIWGANVKTVSGPISVGGNLNVQFDADVATAGASFQVTRDCGYITVDTAGGASVAVNGLRSATLLSVIPTRRPRRRTPAGCRASSRMARLSRSMATWQAPSSSGI